MKFALVVALAGMLCAGCANQNSIYRNSAVGVGSLGARLVTVDAKQRSVAIVPKRETTWTYEKGVASKSRVEETLAVCAEASPDVFSALSTGASGELNASGLVRGGSPELRARAALAIAEAAGTIERTQTINLLRESMYRTCERYLSGAIGRDELVVQSARDGRAMVAILAIEQLTRSVWPKATVINAGAAAGSLQDSSGFTDALRKAVYDSVDADAKSKAAIAAYDSAKCDPLLKATAPTATATDAEKAAKETYEACEAARKLRDTTAVEAAKTAAFVKELKASGAVGGQTNFATTAGVGGSSSQVGVTVDRPSMSEVATAVRSIVQMSYDFDEGEMLCVVKMRAGDISDRALHGSCIELLKAKIAYSTQKYNLLRGMGETIVENAAQRQTSAVAGAMACWNKSKEAFRREARRYLPPNDALLPLIFADDAEALERALSMRVDQAPTDITRNACPAA
jgi:hypothetical protein